MRPHFPNCDRLQASSRGIAARQRARSARRGRAVGTVCGRAGLGLTAKRPDRAGVDIETMGEIIVNGLQDSDEASVVLESTPHEEITSIWDTTVAI